MENLDKQDEVISEMCKNMKQKFDKYWNEYSIVLVFVVVLDPCIKFAMLEYFYSRIDAFTFKKR